MSHDRVIGRVLSVDNFRVFIKIEDNLRGTYVSGLDDIYEVARVNSYLIIPVGSDRVVALITRISMKEEIEFDKSISNISLPSAARYISATMLGTIIKTEDYEKFVQGVYNFPALDNPVWYVTEKDLQHIFDDRQDVSCIDFAKDYYLPIGVSPVFQNYKVKICPDQFFVKHAAILGNTGSGKSCTLASIIRSMFKFDYNGKRLENAHIVIFDTNGEYKDAFIPEDELEDTTQEALWQINAYHYGGDENVKVPYWLMNWDDFKALLRPSDGTQAPVLNRAIGLAKNEQSEMTDSVDSTLDAVEIEHLVAISNVAKSGDWWKAQPLENSYKSFIDRLPSELQNISFSKNAPCPTSQTIQVMDTVLSSERQKKENSQIVSEQNIDLPIWFDYQELCTKFLDAAINQEGTSNNRIAEFVSTLRLRMNSFQNDKSMAIPLMLKDKNVDNRNILAHFIAFILGDFNRYFKDSAPHHFISAYNGTVEPRYANKTNQITIVDVSLLPFEVLETVTALIGRIILEFVSYFMANERGKHPVVIVMEEAQNYISEKNESVAKTVFERIAREGRKYGISLIVCSQRPSELSKTVLSQCNSFIIHRLQNPEDQKYIRGLVSSASADILDQLPIIPQQHAIITGDCVKTPIQVRIDDVDPPPNSHNPKFIESWLSDGKIPYEDTCKRWLASDDAC